MLLIPKASSGLWLVPENLLGRDLFCSLYCYVPHLPLGFCIHSLHVQVFSSQPALKKPTWAYKYRSSKEVSVPLSLLCPAALNPYSFFSFPFEFRGQPEACLSIMQ